MWSEYIVLVTVFFFSLFYFRTISYMGFHVGYFFISGVQSLSLGLLLNWGSTVYQK